LGHHLAVFAREKPTHPDFFLQKIVNCVKRSVAGPFSGSEIAADKVKIGASGQNQEFLGKEWIRHHRDGRLTKSHKYAVPLLRFRGRFREKGRALSTGLPEVVGEFHCRESHGD